MTFHTHTFDNGLRLIHAQNQSDVAYCGYVIDAGTRDEWPTESGMAHCVEHMIFKGTEKRRAWHILNRMELVGGDLNAFTNKEDTTIYSAFLKAHFDRATELLTDIVFHSTFPQHEIDKEIEVIIDEIESYEDSPSDLIFDDFEAQLFAKHPLGRNILGDPIRLRSYQSHDILAFTQRYYQPANMVFFVQGNLDFQHVVKTVGKYTANLPSMDGHPQRVMPSACNPTTVKVKRQTHQAHVMIGTQAYEAHDNRRTPLYLLNNLLGGPGMNSKLNVALRERSGLVYNVEANLTSYTDTGIFSIYFGCDTDDADRCIEITHKELKKLCDHPLTSLQLHAAKKQIIGQIGVTGDNFENNALDMGKTFLHYDKYETQDKIFERIEALTPHDLWEVANDLFVPDRLSTLIYC